MNWLNAIDTYEDEDDEKNNSSEGTGLLLAPINQQPVNELALPVVIPQTLNDSGQNERTQQNEEILQVPNEAQQIMEDIQSWKNEYASREADDFQISSSPEFVREKNETDDEKISPKVFDADASPEDKHENFSPELEDFSPQHESEHEDFSPEPENTSQEHESDHENFSPELKNFSPEHESDHENFSSEHGDFSHELDDEHEDLSPELGDFSHELNDEHENLSPELEGWNNYSYTSENEPDTSEFILQDNEEELISQELHDLQESVKNLQETLDDDTQETSSLEQTEFQAPLLDPDWRNVNTGFELSLDEPPPEFLTKINEQKDDPEDLDYEETQSLQGAAYILKREHGKNFTQRLHQTLQDRKHKAEIERELEAKNKNHHPYIQKTIIICGTLLIVLFFAWLSLLFIQRETPEAMMARAEKFYSQGNFDEAEHIYQRAYKRYPNILTFLTGLADSAEKAGHSQTAQTAREEYARNFPDETKEKKEDDKLNQQENHGQEKQKLASPDTKAKPVKEIVKYEMVKVTQPEEKLTFNEYLHEANHAFNVGMYNRAVINFFHAHELDSNDIRPYIGLAGAYRAKGLYFDAKIILEEARKKFPRNPTLEVERKFLREAR